MSKSELPQIVGIGASAGGLEAIKEFFNHTPVDSGFSFVVIQHLSPEYKSMMTELLSNQTDIPVAVAEQDVVPQVNHIYLIPPSKNLSLKNGKFQLESQDRSYAKPNLPIDLFLESLAKELGERAVGVILSGTGSDGTRGARQLKEAGGLMIAQKLDTARFDGMPKSLVVNNLADYVIDIANMPEVISSYFKHPILKSQDPISIEDKVHEAPLSKIFNALKSKFKTDFSVYKHATISRRIQRRISITRKKDLTSYAEFVQQDYDEQRSLFNEILIGVTSFYRNSDVFDMLFQKHIREYLKEKQNGEVRVWVTGCSTGEEAYTMTMLFLEICEQERLNIDVKVFATDIDQQALAHASNGSYPESIATDLPKEFLSKYLIKSGDHFNVTRQLRERVVFARHDVINDPPFTRIDLISCRNLLIYLQSEIQNQVLNAFNFSLKPSGLLILGNSESLGDAQTYFKPLDGKLKIFESLGINQRTLIGTQRLKSQSLATTADWQRIYKNLPNGSTEKRATEELKILDAALSSLSPEHLAFTLIVNQENEVIRIIGNSEKYLSPMTGRPDFDISKLLVKDISVPVMSGLSRVFRNQKDINYSNVAIRTKGAINKVSLSIVPISIGNKHTSFAAVVITEEKRENGSDESPNYDQEFESISRINDLEQELQFTRENLQATIEELETSNEELQATNEELLASNEELQSTNEELQSVNEELYTVNSEYQSKLREMNILSADMDSLMYSIDMAVIYLDEHLNIRRFTSLATRIFNIIEHDIGRPFEHTSNQILDWDIHKAVKSAVINNEVSEKLVKVNLHGDYLIRVFPSRQQGQEHGVIIVMTGIPAEKKMVNTEQV